MGNEDLDCPNCGSPDKIHLYGIRCCSVCELPAGEFDSDDPSWEKMDEAMIESYSGETISGRLGL